MSIEGQSVHTQSADEPTGNRPRKSRSRWRRVGLPLCILLGLPITCAYIFVPRVESMREPVSLVERDEWIAKVRQFGGLGKLPPSATDIRIGRSGWASSWVIVFQFRADPADIETFLASSPAIEGSTPVVYSTEKVLIRSVSEYTPPSVQGGIFFRRGMIGHRGLTLG